MKCYIRVITTPTADTPGTTLLLHFDQKRYLIGSLAEGTQRAITEMGIRMLKVSEIFLTGKMEWSNTGGMFGMMLTLADASAASRADAEKQRAAEVQRSKTQGEPVPPELERRVLTIYGPPNLNHTTATARRFIFRRALPVHLEEIKYEQPTDDADPSVRPPTFSDECTNIWALPIVPPPRRRESLSPQQRINIKKKSYDDLVGLRTHEHGPQETELERQDRYRQMRRAVVSEMFDSSWRLDALVETPLKDVRMPAKIFVRNPDTKLTEPYTGPLPGGKEAVPDITVLVRQPWPGALVEELPPTDPAPEAISYIIRNHTQRGRFNADKAVALGVPRGPQWSELTRGLSVTARDGTVVTPEQVLDPPRPGGGAAIADLPSHEYVEPFIRRPEWRSKEMMKGIGGFVWILGRDVGSNPALRTFMEEFKHLTHIVSSKDACPNYLSMSSAARSTLLLNQINPDAYRTPAFDNQTTPQEDFLPRASRFEKLPDYLVPAERGLVLALEPHVHLMKNEIVSKLDCKAVVDSTPPEVLQLAQQARDDVKADSRKLGKWTAKLAGGDVEVVTLGTGSALPSKYRNVSSTLFRVPGVGSYLLDCGENTVGQLRRVFKPKEFYELMTDLRMIWISHMHADHHLGTVSVIKAWYNAVHGGKPASSPPTLDGLSMSKPLAVVSDAAMLHWLGEYKLVEDYGYSRIAPMAISSTEFMPNAKHVPSSLVLHHRDSLDDYKPVSTFAYEALMGVSDIQATSVSHCHGAKAVAITFPSGFKISYSGDCRPSLNFTRIGRGSTLLVHEATFDDELVGDALAKKHSTTSEAIAVGAKMGARAVVLTHFSQRYQKIPVMDTVDGEPESDEEMQDADQPELQIGGVRVKLEDAVGDEDDGGPIEGAEGETAPPAKERIVQVPSSDPDAMDTGSQPPSSRVLAAAEAAEREATARKVVHVRNRNMKVAVAFDYMRVKVGEIAQLEKFTPALVQLFSETEKEDGDCEPSNGNGKREKGQGGKRSKRQKSKRFN